MARSSKHAGNGPSRMRDEISSLSGELESLGQHLARLGERAMAEGNTKLTEELGHIQERFESTLDQVNSESRRAAERVGESVQQHPIAAISAALAVGALIGVLLKRNH